MGKLIQMPDPEPEFEVEKWPAAEIQIGDEILKFHVQVKSQRLKIRNGELVRIEPPAAPEKPTKRRPRKPRK